MFFFKSSALLANAIYKWICPYVCLSVCLFTFKVFKASALWADAFYKSKCPSVCLSVCLCVRSLLRYRLTVFLPPLPKVGCPILLEIRNSWGKVMERSGLRYEHFCLKIVKNRRAKKVFFLSFLLLRYRLTVFLPPLSEVGCSILLEIRNPWGKVMERNGLTFEHFCLEVV